MFSQEIQLRVRYADTDQMGYAYYGNYAMYYEVARTEVFRNLGLPYKETEAQGLLMPVLENHSYYHAPAYYDDLLTIKVMIKELPKVKIRFDYEFYNQKQELIHTGNTLLVFLNSSTRKPCRIPTPFLEKIAPYFEKKFVDK
jgi:acyl-CoA thioester hydrolase